MARRNSKGRFVKGSGRKRSARRVHVRAKRRARGKRRPMVGYVEGTKRIRRRKMNPRRRHHYARRRRHSNPRFSIGGIGDQLKAGLVGAGGGLVNALIMGFVTPKLPASISTGYPLHGVRIASALAVGALGKRFAGSTGVKLGEGAMIVAMYLLLKDVATSTVPSLPLGDYQEIELSHPAAALSGMGAYMNGNSLPEAGAGMGAYMEGINAGESVEY